MKNFCEHFGIDSKELDSLKNIKAIDFIKMMRILKDDIEESIVPVVDLMCYIDSHGDFTETKTNQDKIAKAMFNSLDSHGKVEIMLYLSWFHGDEDD